MHKKFNRIFKIFLNIIAEAEQKRPEKNQLILTNSLLHTVREVVRSNYIFPVDVLTFRH